MHSRHDIELAVDWQSTADSTGFTNCLGPVDWQSTGQNLELSHSVRSTGSRPGLDRQFISQSTGSRPEVDRQAKFWDRFRLLFFLISDFTSIHVYCIRLVLDIIPVLHDLLPDVPYYTMSHAMLLHIAKLILLHDSCYLLLVHNMLKCEVSPILHAIPKTPSMIYTTIS